jgi:hypothetical protein
VRSSFGSLSSSLIQIKSSEPFFSHFLPGATRSKDSTGVWLSRDPYALAGTPAGCDTVTLLLRQSVHCQLEEWLDEAAIEWGGQGHAAVPSAHDGVRGAHVGHGSVAEQRLPSKERYVSPPLPPPPPHTPRGQTRHPGPAALLPLVRFPCSRILLLGRYWAGSFWGVCWRIKRAAEKASSGGPEALANLLFRCEWPQQSASRLYQD